MSIQSINPRTATAFGRTFDVTSDQETVHMITAAVAAQKIWGAMSAHKRGETLHLVADLIDSQATELVEIADQETGLGKVRLTGEVARTTFQLRLLADAASKEGFFAPELDSAVEGAPPQGHPNFLRTKRPIGVVTVFGASNFPFAFSVLGGDTASALAAGCAVVIKAHSAHPQTSQLSYEIAMDALKKSGAPAGLIALGHGRQFGTVALTDPRVSAGAFTGSRSGGRALFDIAQSRPNPIPFYGELGSVNPVVVLQSALTDVAALATGYLDSLLLGNGQFCTNPSLLFVPESDEFLTHVKENLATREASPFLSELTQSLHDENRDHVRSSTEPLQYAGKSAPGEGFFSTPEVFVLTAAKVKPEELAEECFGPTGIIVTYKNLQELNSIVAKLEGALVGAVFASKDDSQLPGILNLLAGNCGRVVLNAWPTGVAVTAGQHHGGPYPAATSVLHTSVGVHAISRFLRPVTFQGLPDALYRAVTSEPVKGN